MMSYKKYDEEIIKWLKCGSTLTTHTIAYYIQQSGNHGFVRTQSIRAACKRLEKDGVIMQDCKKRDPYDRSKDLRWKMCDEVKS